MTESKEEYVVTRASTSGEVRWVSIKLEDGRVVRVYPSGNVQVRPADESRGVEFRLPDYIVSAGNCPVTVDVSWLE